MNAKKCKIIRKTLLKEGVDWRETKHVQQVYKDQNGKEQHHPTIFLKHECGRSIYQQLKNRAKYSS